MENSNWWPILLICMDLVLRLGLSIRVIMRRLPVGVSLAWLFVVVTFPFAGAIAYLLLGELRLGVYRAARAAEMRAPFRTWLDQVHVGDVDWTSRPYGAEALARMCQKMTGMPVTAGNRLDLIGNSADALKALVEAINEAKSSCHLEFYIWTEGGLADKVAEALMAASARGVTCRMLLDDVGSREFLRSDWVPRLQESGVAVEAALRARLWRLIFVRFDLRLHRKLAIVDGRVAYTGSMNLVDARLFQRSAGVGEWVDACVRVEGPAVEPMGVTFLGDWALESEENLERLKQTGDVRPQEHQGSVPVQVLPSGPSDPRDAIERILLAFIYSARAIDPDHALFRSRRGPLGGFDLGRPAGRESHFDHAREGRFATRAIGEPRHPRRPGRGGSSGPALPRGSPAHQVGLCRRGVQSIWLAESRSTEPASQF